MKGTKGATRRFIPLIIYLFIAVQRCSGDNEEPIQPPTTLINNSSAEEEVLDSNVNTKLDSVNLVQSSFEDTIDEDTLSRDYAFTDVLSQNSGISNGVLDTGQPIVTTFVDTATNELKQHAEIPPLESSQNLTKQTLNHTDPNSHINLISDPEELTEEQNHNRSDPTSNASTQTTDENIVLDVPKIPEQVETENGTEEIPSFSEWTQKQLEEAEKKETINTSTQNNGNWNNNSNSNKVRLKNYASPDCGAKVLNSNPEAGSPNNVLTPNSDEYILNTCTSRIWFIVELCEPIQAKRIEMGNFELFSSTPKDFTISVSDRYSSREWTVVGKYTAQDERKLQSFELQPHLFGRFIKFEMQSHYGSEHYCPISMLRVYGTTEFEVLEKETHSNPADYEDVDDLDQEKVEVGGNLFSSATDAVIKIVNKAREVLGNKGNHSNLTTNHDGKITSGFTTLITSCTTPSHIVVCNNCSDTLFGQVYELLSCKSRLLGELLQAPLIKETVYNSELCSSFGIDFRTKRTGIVSNIVSNCIQSFFPSKYLAAFCNTAAIIENQVVLNISKNCNGTQGNLSLPNTSQNLEDKDDNLPLVVDSLTEVEPTQELTQNIESTVLDLGVTEISYTAEIKPTKTLTPAETAEARDREFVSTDYPQEAEELVEEVELSFVEEGSAENREELNSSVENVELDNYIQVDVTTPSPMPPVASQGKESVFIKLSNRIKVLERNMSLSSQYLEELSRRYRKQVDEMQKLIDKTINTLHAEGVRKDTHIQKLEEKINNLAEIVDNLAAEKNTWLISSYWLLSIAVIIFALLTFCQRNEFIKHRRISSTSGEVQRRKSIAVVNHNTPSVKVRRPSEEALNISGSYQHLMIDNNVDKKKFKERKRKKKRNASVASITELNGRHSEPFGFVPSSGNSSKLWTRQESAPCEFSLGWNKPSLSNAIQDIPFVLEESDHSPLENLPLPKPLRETPPDSIETIVSSMGYMKTAQDARSVRNGSSSIVTGNSKSRLHETQHRKSASVDETRRQKSPAPSAGNFSLNIEYDETAKPVQKKRGGGFKRIFSKKLFERK